MVMGGLMHRGPAFRGPRWRLMIAALAIALVCAASIATVWHAEHAGDQDCAICQLRHQPAADLTGSIQIGSADTPEPLVQAPRAGWVASGHLSPLPARAPPA